MRPDSARRWGRMSAHQMICHLSDAFRMGLGQRPAGCVGGVLHRTILRWAVLYAPLRWPRGIVTVAEIDQELGGTKPADFASDVAQLEALLGVVTTRPRDFQWQPHPIFGAMSTSAWLRWGYLHMDHHLRQFGA